MLYFTLTILAVVPAPYSHLSTPVHQELVIASTQAACLEYGQRLLPALRAKYGNQYTFVPECRELTQV